MYSLIVPVYKNEAGIPALLDAIAELNHSLGGELECVFVVDGSPDRCHALLHEALPQRRFRSQLLLLSRNFGSFAAIREGLRAARGELFAVMAADLQEPPELVLEFFRALREEPIDVVLGTREARDDPWRDRWASNTFWRLYRAVVQPEMPAGGVDIFACAQAFRDRLVELPELNTSLVGQVLWLGFRRKTVAYTRRARQFGKSAWTLRKKVNYLLDSVFAFTDFPIKALLATGMIGLLASLLLGAIVLAARLYGWIAIPGYTATVLVIVFFAALNLFGLGVVGSYAWRAYENSKQRPTAVVMFNESFSGVPRP